MYYGGEVYRREALPSSDSLYWEVRLPDFNLGQSIQRYEVETLVRLQDLEEFRERRDEITRRYQNIKTSFGRFSNILNPKDWSQRQSYLKAQADSLSDESDILSENLAEVTKQIARENSSYMLSKDLVAFDSLLAVVNEIGADSIKRNVFGFEQDTILLSKSKESWAAYLEAFEKSGLLKKVLKFDTTNALQRFDSMVMVTDKKELLADDTVNMRTRLKEQLGSLLSQATVNIDSIKPHFHKPNKDLVLFTDVQGLVNNQGLLTILQPTILKIQASIAFATDTTISNLVWQAKVWDIQTLSDHLYKSIRKIESKVLNIDTIKQVISQLNDENTDFSKDFTSILSDSEALQDSIKNNLISNLIDKDYTGIGIKKADIIIDNRLETARILYRNYKLQNRELQALDPAEDLGVFRLRYIPFPVVGDELAGPARSGFPIVFEAGLTFGSRTIVSNELFDPGFSISRLGVAFAFTPKFFQDDAEILALALTYDFNTYGSIGVGANFGAHSENRAEPYFSLGINQRVFQEFISGVKNIFQNEN